METKILFRMHKRNQLEKGIWKDANPLLEMELSSQYGVGGAEGLEEDDYFAMPSMDAFLSSDLEILKKYNYVISKIEVVAWGEVLNHDGSVIECVFKISDVVKAEELY